MGNAESTFETKLKQLERTEDKTSDVLKGGKRSAVSRHLTNLKELLTEVDNARRAFEAEKIAAKVSDEEISAWNDGIMAKIEVADGQIENLEEWLARLKMEVENQEREEKMQFEIKLHESKLKLQEDLQLKIGNLNQPAETPVSQAKLPKLVITKFNGTYADWPRFWGQYSESIDKSSVPPVTKFTYLRELLDARVRKTVEALPQTAEGYNRALTILKDRFGKESEIVKAYGLHANRKPQKNSRILRKALLQRAIPGNTQIAS